MSSVTPTVGDRHRADRALVIIAEPINRYGSYRVLFGNRVVIASTRQPLPSAARALLAAGHGPDAMLEMCRPGAREYALRGRLADAARLTVHETREERPYFKLWKPPPHLGVSITGESSEDGRYHASHQGSVACATPFVPTLPEVA